MLKQVFELKNASFLLIQKPQYTQCLMVFLTLLQASQQRENREWKCFDQQDLSKKSHRKRGASCLLNREEEAKEIPVHLK